MVLLFSLDVNDIEYHNQKLVPIEDIPSDYFQE